MIYTWTLLLNHVSDLKEWRKLTTSRSCWLLVFSLFSQIAQTGPFQRRHSSDAEIWKDQVASISAYNSLLRKGSEKVGSSMGCTAGHHFWKSQKTVMSDRPPGAPSVTHRENILLRCQFFTKVGLAHFLWCVTWSTSWFVWMLAIMALFIS